MRLSDIRKVSFLVLVIFLSNLCACNGNDTAHDANHNTNQTTLKLRPLNNTDKHYIKLDKHGHKIANQNASWLSTGNEQAGTQWSCIQDSKTGFIWEVKSDDPNSPRAQQLNYTWHSQSLAHNGGKPGAESTAMCNQVKCTTAAYQNYLNETALCGITDWQLPSVLQFQTIVDHHKTPRAIDTDYFPLSQNSHYWTRHSYAPNRDHAWYLYFSDGSVSHTLKGQPMYLRLVWAKKKTL